MDGMAIVLGGSSTAYLALCLAHAARFRPGMPRAPGRDLPPLTVLKPLHGDEPRLEEALRSFCTQSYPGKLQIVFGVADPTDTAVPLVERLIEQFPDLDLVLVRGTGGRGTNRKVANLLGMLPVARHGLLALSDSDVLLAGPDHLAAVAAELELPSPPNGLPAGAVTCLYRAWPMPDAASRFAGMHIDHHFLTSALVARRFGPPDTCYGKLTMLRRDTLDTAGGLDALADQVADDAALGWMLRKAGYGVRVSMLLARTVVSETAGSLWRHELRWARTVRSTEPAGHAMTIITHCLPIVAVAAAVQPDAVTAGAAVILLALRTALHRVMARRLGTDPAPVWQIAGREAACFAIWLASYAQRTVEWQGRLLTLGIAGGIAASRPALGPRRGGVSHSVEPAVLGEGR